MKAAEKSAIPAASMAPRTLSGLLAAAEEAEARYDHETAVGYYTAALDLPDLTIEERFRILDGRAHVYFRWGHRQGHTADTAALLDLTSGMNDKRKRAEVLAVHGFYETFAGDLTGLEDAGQEALALAGDLEDDRLRAYAYLLLGASDSQRETEFVGDYNDKALSLARRTGDSRLLQFVLFRQTAALAFANRPAEAQTYAAEGRRLASQSGDLLSQAWALFLSGFGEIDLARKRSYYEQAIAISQTANLLLGDVNMANGMSLLLTKLGLYARALAYALISLDAGRRQGALVEAANNLDAVGRAYLGRGVLDEAEAAFDEGFQLLAQQPFEQSFLAYGLAQVALARGQFDRAIDLLDKTAELNPSMAATAGASLGQVYRLQGDFQRALQSTQKAVDHVLAGEGITEYSTQEIWWSHYQVLRDLGRKDEAFVALDSARSAMMEGIATLSDEGLRRNYLNKVSVNRDITLAWTAEAAQRGLSLDPFIAHEPPTGNLRQQFRRVVEIGSRLSAQHDPSTLAGFIVEEFVEMSGAERVLLMLLDEEGALQTAASFNPEDAALIAETVFASLAKDRQPLATHDLGDVPSGSVPHLHQRSAIALPLIAQDKLLGMLYGDMRQIFGRFDDADLNLLSMLANQAAAALENASLVSNLEAKVENRTAELNRRVEELEIINSIQQGLAAELDFQAIVDLVGDRLRDIFNGRDFGIRWYDTENKMIHYVYSYEKGKKIKLPPGPPAPGGLYETITTSRVPILLNAESDQEQLHKMTVPGTATSKSAIVVPLISAGRVIGAIGIEDYEAYDAFGESELRLLTTLASSMSVALENARHFQETEQRNNELAVINTVQQGLVAELGLDAIYEVVGLKLMEIYPEDSISIYSLDRQNGLAIPRFNVEGGQRLYLEPFEPGPIGRTMIEEKRALIMDSLAAFEEVGAITVGDSLPSYSGMFVPLITGDTVVGTLNIENPRSEHAYDHNDLRVLSTLANSMSAALENARLFAETTRHARETAALADVGRDISATLDLQDVLERIAAHALEMLDVSDSALFLPEESHEQMRSVVALGAIAEQVKSTVVRPGSGIMGDVWRRRAPEMINDAAEDPRSINIEGTPDRDDERMMVAPLLSGEVVLGLMTVWRHGAPFTDADLQFLDGLARQAAIAIQNARLYSEAATAREEAEKANATKSRFLANMSHELRTPLNAIIGFTRIIKRKTKDVVPEKQLDNMDKVLASAEHLLGLINTILDIAKIEAGRMDVVESRFQVAPLVDLCAMTTQPLLKPGVKLIQEVSPELPPLVTDQDKLKQILLNLLSNAAKFTHEGAITIHVQRLAEAASSSAARAASPAASNAKRQLPAGTDAQMPVLVIDVIDTGIGMDDEQLGRVFEEFQQADAMTTRQYGGTGLGLPISKQLAQLLGGDLTAESRLGDGTTFTLVLPWQPLVSEQ